MWQFSPKSWISCIPEPFSCQKHPQKSNNILRDFRKKSHENFETFKSLVSPETFETCQRYSGPCHDLRQTMSNFQIILIDAMNLAHSSQELSSPADGTSKAFMILASHTTKWPYEKKIWSCATNFVNFLKSFLIYRIEKLD